jgi:Uma2 family endonuclease
MTIATRLHDTIDHEPIVIDGVSWETYESLVEDFERSSQRKRVTYDRGRMVIVSPLPKHEVWKSLIGCFVEAIADEKNIPIATFGSTTWRRKDKKRGLEPDECFYIQHEAAVRGKMEFDLQHDAAPDLAIEVDLRQDLIDKLGVYAALGIGEIWSFDGDDFETLVLQPGGSYRKQEHSAAFPFLKPANLKQFIDLYGTMDQNSILRKVRTWARSL